MIDNETIENAAKLYCKLRKERDISLEPEKCFIAGVHWFIGKINKAMEE